MKRLLFTILLLLPLLSGCRTVQYTSPEGAKLFYGNVGFATNIDTLTIKKGDTQVEMTGFKSEAQTALDLANKALDKVP